MNAVGEATSKDPDRASVAEPKASPSTIEPSRKPDDSEQRFRRLVESTAIAVWETDIDGNLVGVSPRWEEFTGLTFEASRGEGWLAAVHPEDREMARRLWQEGLTRRTIVEADFRLRDAPDMWRWVKASAAPLAGPDGEVSRWIGMCIDIDSFKRLEDRQAMLVAELQHRTRNLIGLVKSMAAQTLADTETRLQFKTTFEERLQALSRVQGMLSRADQEPIAIGALVRLELDAMGAAADRGRVTLDGPEVNLPKSVVQTFALALHELATNATKYGALANDHGRLVVKWRETPGGAGRRLFLDWTELGLDLERELQGPMTRGFGRQLIEEALPYSHGAKTSFELHKSGVRCTIDLPLET